MQIALSAMQVPLRPRMQRVALPAPADLANTSLLVPEALGSITALSGCPAGTFIAAGTSRQAKRNGAERGILFFSGVAGLSAV